MPKLFKEYEQRKNLPNLIGKKFYWSKWSKNSSNGGSFERKSSNEFMIVHYHMSKKGYEDSIIYYQYLIDGLPGDCNISQLLEYATPIDD